MRITRALKLVRMRKQHANLRANVRTTRLGPSRNARPKDVSSQRARGVEVPRLIPFLLRRCSISRLWSHYLPTIPLAASGNIEHRNAIRLDATHHEGPKTMVRSAVGRGSEFLRDSFGCHGRRVRVHG